MGRAKKIIKKIIPKEIVEPFVPTPPAVVEPEPAEPPMVAEPTPAPTPEPTVKPNPIVKETFTPEPTPTSTPDPVATPDPIVSDPVPVEETPTETEETAQAVQRKKKGRKSLINTSSTGLGGSATVYTPTLLG